MNDIGWAIKQMRENGWVVKRKGWVTSCIYIGFDGYEYSRTGKKPPEKILIGYMVEGGTSIGIWRPFPEDLLATDWELYDEQ